MTVAAINALLYLPGPAKEETLSGLCASRP